VSTLVETADCRERDGERGAYVEQSVQREQRVEAERHRRLQTRHHAGGEPSQPVDLREHTARRADEGLALIGELRHLRRPIPDRDRELGLEVRHRRADRGLDSLQLPRGSGEAALLDDRHERAKLVERDRIVHRATISPVDDERQRIADSLNVHPDT